MFDFLRDALGDLLGRWVGAVFDRNDELRFIFAKTVFGNYAVQIGRNIAGNARNVDRNFAQVWDMVSQILFAALDDIVKVCVVIFAFAVRIDDDFHVWYKFYMFTNDYTNACLVIQI